MSPDKNGPDKKIEGPSYGPHGGGKPGHMVLLLHGYGADGNDLIGLAPLLGQLMPDVVFHAPNAPHPCEGNPFGYQWFGISRLDPAIALAGVRAAAPFVDAFLDEKFKETGLDESKTVLVGFSQGTMMSLHVGLRRKKQLAGIVGLSGMLAGAELLQSEATAKPPVLLVHGQADEMLPAAMTERAAQALTDAGFDTEAYIIPDIGHTIDDNGLQLTARFLLKAFGIPEPQ
jgi:phospholipase/carboxylesterase